MSSTSCEFAVALWQVVGEAIAMMVLGAFFMWLWFIKLGNGEWSENGQEEESAISFSSDKLEQHSQ